MQREWERASSELQALSISPPQAGKEHEKAWKDAFNTAYHQAFRGKDEMKAMLLDQESLKLLKEKNHNNEIAEWVLQEERTVRIVNLEQGLSPTSSPIHHHTHDVSGWNAPYYSASKSLLGENVRTPLYNVFCLWLMTAIAWVILRCKRMQ